MTNTYGSVFSYNVSRSYPCRWFTWVVFVGGVIATVIFSLINFVAAGFESVTVYTTNVTQIEEPENPAWYQRQPWSFASKIAPNCTAQLISPGSTLYTSYGAFPYTVDRIIIDLNDTEPKSLGPQAYKNTPIGNCTSITIKVDLDISNPHIEPVWDVQIHSTCAIHFAEQDAFIELLSEFAVNDFGFGDLAGTTQRTPIGIYNQPADGPGSSSLEWAKILMQVDYAAWFYLSDLNTTSNFISHMDSFWYINATSSEDPVAAFSDFQFANQSSVQVQLAAGNVTEVDGSLKSPLLGQWNNGSYDNHVPMLVFENSTYEDITITTHDWDGQLEQSAVLTDGIGKLIYWTLLTDLGQSATNVLADPRGLMEYTIANVQYLCSRGLTDLFEQTSEFGLTCNLSALSYRNVQSFYAASPIGTPNVQPAVFAQEYSCQVPKLKSAGGLIISILVADLVFLQALWKILNWLTTLVLTRRDKRANYCAGCEEALTELRRLTDDIETGSNQTTHIQVLPKNEAGDSAPNDDESSALMQSVDGNNQHLSKDEETGIVRET